MLDTEARTCACGKPLRPDNTSGVCYLCQRRNRGCGSCADCGRRLSRRNRFGRCDVCRRKRIAAMDAEKP